MEKGLKFMSAVHPQTCYVRRGSPEKGSKMESVIFSGIDMTDKVEKAYPDGAQQYKSRALTGNTKIADGEQCHKNSADGSGIFPGMYG